VAAALSLVVIAITRRQIPKAQTTIYRRLGSFMLRHSCGLSVVLEKTSQMNLKKTLV
jgi:hypothetical protein